MLGGLVATGWSASLRELAVGLTGALPLSLQPTAVVAVYVVVLMLINELGRVPVELYRGFLLERRYGLSNQRLLGWVADQGKGLVLVFLLAAGAACMTYCFIRLSPDQWWLPSGIVFALVIVGLANLGPVVLLPIFYSVTPLRHESLRRRLIRLAERADARVLGAYEWGLGAKTKKANAALTGLGGTRRILVSDTMLAEYSEEEIEVVLAHELAHHVHGDIWKGLLFESALILIGGFTAAQALRWFAPVAGLTGPEDVAGLPFLVLVAGAVSLVMLPFAHAISRAYERKADRFALELTKNPEAFISAMRRLGAQSLAEEHPTQIVKWLFYSHPPIRERIAAAKQFAS